MARFKSAWATTRDIETLRDSTLSVYVRDVWLRMMAHSGQIISDVLPQIHLILWQTLVEHVDVPENATVEDRLRLAEERAWAVNEVARGRLRQAAIREGDAPLRDVVFTDSSGLEHRVPADG